MKTLLIDDEKPAIDILSGFVNRVPFLELSLTTTNAFEAIEWINKQAVDLLLLDIEMPDISGIELLGTLAKPPMTIFTTAYEQYALQGYELDIVDYLVKPIRFERFLKAVNKAYKHFKNTENSLTNLSNHFLLVKVDYQTVRIHFKDIIYIEGLKDYVKIFTAKEMILSRINLKGIAKKLPEDQFIRIHRSFIVSIPQITAFQKSNVTIGHKNLPIGAAYQQQVIQRLS